MQRVQRGVLVVGLGDAWHEQIVRARHLGASAEIAAGNTLYTNGNGTTTFGIPDMRGRMRAAKDNMGVRQLPGLQTRFLVSATAWARLVARRHTRSRSRSCPPG